MIKNRYHLHINTPETGQIWAAELVLLEENKQLRQVGFRYTDDFLSHPKAFALDPAQLPLSKQEKRFICHNAAPAILDDYLPDDWGRKLLVKIAYHQRQQRLNANCVSDVLASLQNNHSRIGALCITKPDAPAIFSPGISLGKLQEAEDIAVKIDADDGQGIDHQTLGLLYLANSGTGVGGARPKALVYDDEAYYLAKFNRHRDSFNNARVELACLQMAQAAGIRIGNGKVVSSAFGREVLLLERFDIQPSGRYHLITANGLLKDQHNQQDLGYSFRYDDLYQLIQKHSIAVEDDLKQLLRLMLFNRAINNTDDHERNFSFIYQDGGYRFAPAYDLVPSLSTGEYHAASYGYQPFPPLPQEIEKQGKAFGLRKGDVQAIAQQVQAAVLNWSSHAQNAGVSEEDQHKVQQVLLK